MNNDNSPTSALPIVAGKVGATLLAVYLLAVVVRIGSCYEPDARVRDELAGRGPQIGEQFPPFELADVEGERIGTTDVNGAPTVVLFVPSLDWSPPTKARLLDLAEALRERRDVRAIVVLTKAQATPRGLRFVRERQLPMRFLVDNDGFAAKLGLSVPAPDGTPTAIPATFALDAAGIVRLRDVRRDARTWPAPEAILVTLGPAGAVSGDDGKRAAR